MSFINLVIANTTININENSTEFHYQKDMELKVIANYTEKKEYLKIEVQLNKENNEYVLSYYEKDSTFKNRKQLSQSISGKAFIYLKKEQMNDTFYITISSENSDLNDLDYKLCFIQKEKMELNLGEQYSYYVTDENNSKMEFFINGTAKRLDELNITSSDSYYTLSIWARGYKNINAKITDLNGKENINKAIQGFNAYLLKLENSEKFAYTFTVEGNHGDLIKVGALLYDKDNLCQTIIKDHKMEIFGYLKVDDMKDVKFLTSKNLNLAFDTINSNYYLFSQKNIIIDKYNDSYDEYKFLMDKNKAEQFYLFQFSKAKESKFIIYSPLMLGGSYILTLKKEEKVGLLPMLSENNEYITYQTTPLKGNHKSNMESYTDYPFCKNVEKKNENSLLQYYYSSSITYNKTEYNNKSTPIDHNQKLLVLTCESIECIIFVSIYTDKNKPTIFPSMNYYRYIRKGIKDNFNIDLTYGTKDLNGKNKWFINIEVINGDASDLNVTLPKSQAITKNNKLLYESNIEKFSDIPLSIEAVNKNLIYSIMIKIGEDAFSPQINYLIKYDKNTKQKIFNFDIDDKVDELYYVGFYRFSENEFEIEKSEGNNKTILKGDNFYQEIKEVKLFNEKYNIASKNKSVEKSFFELSLFRFNDRIILSNNNVHPFMFTQKYTQFKFIYLHSYNKKDINIVINLLNNATYKIDLLVNNNVTKKKEYQFNKTENISISSKDLQKDEYQPNKIEFDIKSEANSIIEIKIIEEENNKGTTPIKPNGNEDKDKENRKRRIFIIISCSIIGFIIILIIVVIIILCKSKKSYDDLREKVNSVSFKDDKVDKNDEEDDLLD